MILLALFWCLGFQDASWPELPPKLKANDELRLAYEGQLQNGSPEQRRAAAERIFQDLPGADQAVAGDFLLLLSARNELDGVVDLGPALQAHLREWQPFAARIEEVLTAHENDHGTDHKAALVNGALRAAGLLELADAARVEAVAKYLDLNGFGPTAREALLAITRREFRTSAQFEAWWETAANQSRTEWILSANDDATAEVLRLWASLIAADPTQALDALAHDRVEVRELGLAQLASLPVDAVDSQGRALPTVVLAALEREVDPALRSQMTRLVPRVFPEGRQVEVLYAVLIDPNQSDAVRVAACETLSQARPTGAATLAFVDALETVYASQADSWGSLPVRTKLVSSLFQHVNGNSQAAEALQPPVQANAADSSATDEGTPTPEATPLERLEGAVSAALMFEQAPEITSSLFRLVGAVGSDRTLVSLLAGAMNRPGLQTGPRQAAIEAYGSVVGRVGINQQVLDNLKSLLDDADENIRFAAASALAESGADEAFVMLADRLLVDAASERMSQRLLKMLQKGKDVRAVPALLQFAPQEKHRSLYRDVLDRHINGDVGVRLQAIDAMLARADWELAWRMDKGPQLAAPAEVDAADAAAVASLALRVRAQVGWALHNPIVPQADDAVVTESFRRLDLVRAAQPEALEWKRLRAELHLRIGQDAEAFPYLEEVLPQLETGAMLDQLAVAAMQAAGRLEQDERGRVLAGRLSAMSTPEATEALKAAVDALALAAEEIATSDPKGSPPPAEGDDGAAEQTGEPEAGQEQPVEKPETPTEEPGNGSGGGDGGSAQPEEPASEEPDGSGDGFRA